MPYKSSNEVSLAFFYCRLRNALLKKGLESPEMLQRVSYNSLLNVESGNPSFKNVISNIPRLLPSQIIRDNEPSESCIKLMVRLEQKSIVLKRDLTCGFYKAVQLVLDHFLGILSISKAV